MKKPAPIGNCEVLGRVEQLPDGRVLVIPTGAGYAVSVGTFPVPADESIPDEAIPALVAFFREPADEARS